MLYNELTFEKCNLKITVFTVPIPCYSEVSMNSINSFTNFIYIYIYSFIYIYIYMLYIYIYIYVYIYIFHTCVQIIQIHQYTLYIYIYIYIDRVHNMSSRK